MPPTLTIVSIIGAIPLLVEGIAQAVRSSLDDVEVLAEHSSIADAGLSPEGGIVVLVSGRESADVLLTVVDARSIAGARVLVVSHGPNAEVARRVRASGAFGHLSSRESLTSMVSAVSAVRAGAGYWSDEASSGMEVAVLEVPELSARELEVVGLYLSGKTVRETAAELGISVQTVRAHLVRVRARLRKAGFEVSSSISLKHALGDPCAVGR